MRFLPVGLAFAVLAVICGAILLKAQPNYDEYGVEMPPAKYDHEPSVPVVLSFMSSFKIHKTCGNDVALACAYSYANFCAIHLPNDASSQALLDDLLIHEKAHCNGWVH